MFNLIHKSQLSKFLLVGAFNTAITYVVYLLLIQAIPPWLSYLISYGLGVVIAFYLNKNWAFNADVSHRALPSFFVLHVILATIGTLVCHGISGHLPGWMIAPIAVLFNIPLSFLLTKLFFKMHGNSTNNPSINKENPPC